MVSEAGVGSTIDPILDWLMAEPEDDCMLELDALEQNLGVLIQPEIPVSEILGCVDQIDARALDIVGRFKPQLVSAAQPLPHDLGAASARLAEALRDLAAMLRRAARICEVENPDSSGRAAALRLAGRAMRLLCEAYLLDCMRGADTTAGVWQQALGLHAMLSSALSGGANPVDAAAGLLQFKRMFAVSALQPESMTARELLWITEYLEISAGAVELSSLPITPDRAAFWADPDEDQAPLACARRLAPARSGLLYFSALGIARRVGEQIDWLDRRISEAEVVGLERDGELLDPDSSGLPLGLTPVEVVSLLNRLRDRWTSPPNREFFRRPNLYSAQVCLGLRAIWSMFRQDAAPRQIVEWTVCNESPSGFGLLSVAGSPGDVMAGMVLALRRDAREPWSICLVRWLRVHDDERVELGLQVLSNACVPVSVGFRGSEIRQTAHALLLPPLPGVRNNSAILAPAGTYTSRRFVMVREGGQVYVAQGRVLGLDLQTACIELFQYEIDPFPI